MSLKTKLESILFVASRPLSLNKLVELLGVELSVVKEALEELKQEYNVETRGIQLITHHSKVQLVTHPDSRKSVEAYLKDEQFGELTKPSLETLTIIAYRGPITKPELEQIRGVNCSLILRNLMIKGLVEAEEDKEHMQTVYKITFDFVHYLGIRNVSELPDYDKLSHHETLEKVLALNQDKPAEEQ